jgi:ribosomal-protein-alanine N-acetyltransferase
MMTRAPGASVVEPSRVEADSEEGDLVFDTLRTSRLLLRPLAPEDAPAVHAYTSDSNVMRYVPEGVMSVEQVQAFIAENQPNSAALAAVLTSEERLIGHLTFHPWYAPRIYEIGWVFHPQHHGQGYATESATALFAFGFETLGLHRIIATCQPENVASWRVMEKLGMVREAHFRKVFTVDETTWLDEYLYAILEEEWFSRAADRSPIAG